MNRITSVRTDPTENYLFSCNQRSDDITAFRVQGHGHELDFTGRYTAQGNPAIIVFLT